MIRRILARWLLASLAWDCGDGGRYDVWDADDA